MSSSTSPTSSITEHNPRSRAAIPAPPLEVISARRTAIPAPLAARRAPLAAFRVAPRPIGRHARAVLIASLQKSSLVLVLIAAAAACGGSQARPAVRSSDAVERVRALRLVANWDGARDLLKAELATATGAARLPLLLELAAVEHDTNSYRRRDQLAAAIATLAEAEPLLAGAGPADRAEFAERRGWIIYSKAFRKEASFDDARRFFEEARALREPLGDQRDLPMNWFGIGLTYQQAEHMPEALTAFKRGLEIAERAGDIVSQGYLQRHLGYVESELAKDPKVAVPYYERSLELRERGGHRWGIVFAAILLADAKRQTGDTARARQLLERAITLGQELRIPNGVGHANEALAELDAAEGKLEAACGRLANAVAALDTFGDAKARESAEKRRSALSCPTPPST